MSSLASQQLYRREFMCYFKLVHKVPGGNSGPDSAYSSGQQNCSRELMSSLARS